MFFNTNECGHLRACRLICFLFVCLFVRVLPMKAVMEWLQLLMARVSHFDWEKDLIGESADLSVVAVSLVQVLPLVLR